MIVGARDGPDKNSSDNGVGRPLLEVPPGRPAAIRFLGEHKGRGMHILLRYGAAQAFPDWVFLCSREHLSLALPRLVEAGVQFATNDSISTVMPSGARSVAALPGWRFPTSERAPATDEAAGK